MPKGVFLNLDRLQKGIDIFEMKLRLTLPIFLLFLACESDLQVQKVTIISDVNVLSMLDSTIKHSMDIEIVDGTIVEIRKHRKDAESPDHVQVIQGKGRFAMPGLGDAHIHLPRVASAAKLQRVMDLLLCHGITWARNTAGSSFQLDFLATNSDACPDIYMGSPILRGDHFTSLQQLGDSLDQFANADYDFLKVHRFLKAEQLGLIEEVSLQANIPLQGHLPHSTDLVAVLNTGRYDILDHLDGFFTYLSGQLGPIENEVLGVYNEDLASQVDLALLPGLTDRILASEVAIVPTLSLLRSWYDFDRCQPGVYRNTEYLEPGYMTRWNQLLVQVRKRIKHDADFGRKILSIREQIVNHLNRANVTLLLGSGAYEVDGIPGFALADEVEALHEAGLHPFEVLRTCTVAIGEYFGLDRGTIEVGKPADFILLGENPLQNLTTLRTVKGVFFKNHWLEEKDLAKMLREARID